MGSIKMSKWLSIFHSTNNIPPSTINNNNNLNQDSNFGERSKNINNQTNNLLSFAKIAKTAKNTTNNLNDHSFGNFDIFGKHTKNLKSIYYENELDRVESFEECVAIVEFDLNIPYVWAKAIVELQLGKKPTVISQEKWNKVMKALGILCDSSKSCFKDIVANEWSMGDVFGCHRSAPEARYDVMGSLMLLNEGDRIVEITKDAIRMQNRIDVIQSYYRRFDNCLLKRSFLHEIA
jgi:hypothetical protein